MGNQYKFLTAKAYPSCFVSFLFLSLTSQCWSQDEPPQPILEIGKGILQGETGYAKFTPNDQEIVTCFEEILFWDATTGELLRSVPGAGAIALTLDGEAILVGNGLTLEMREIKTGNLLQTYESPFIISTTAISPDNSMVLIGAVHYPATVFLFNATTGERIQEYEFIGLDRIVATEFSQDGKFFIIGADEWPDTTLRVYSTTTLEQMRYIRTGGNYLFGAAISDNSKKILTWGYEYHVKLSNVDDDQYKSYVDDWCITAAVSPDASMVLLGMDYWGYLQLENTALLIDAETGEELRSFEFPGSGSSVDFSPDGTKVLTTGGGRVMIWDISDLTGPAGVEEWEKYSQ